MDNNKINMLREALKGVIRVADRATDEFDAARAALAATENEAGQPPKLEDIEQYRMQMAGISTGALGYWKEGDDIHPDYGTPALRDVAKLYAKYDALYKAGADQPRHVGMHPALAAPYGGDPAEPRDDSDREAEDIFAQRQRSTMLHGVFNALTDQPRPDDFAKIVRARNGQQVLFYKECVSDDGNTLHIVTDFGTRGQADTKISGIPDADFAMILDRCRVKDADDAIRETSVYYPGGVR